MRRGFTMTELLITLVIIGVMATMLIPRLGKTKAKVYQREAESYLRAIRIAQKQFYAGNGQYACSSACASAAAINTALGGLGITVKERGYVFSMTSSTATTFTATATRSSDGKTTTLNQDGTWGGTYTPLPAA